jgi:hypothetical protein
MGSVLKRLRPSSGEHVDQQAAAEQEAAAKPVQAEPATPPAETDEATGGSERTQSPPQQEGSD